MSKAKDITYMGKLIDCSAAELKELITHASIQYLCKVNAMRSRIKADIQMLGYDMNVEIDLKLNNLKAR